MHVTFRRLSSIVGNARHEFDPHPATEFLKAIHNEWPFEAHLNHKSISRYTKKYWGKKKEEKILNLKKYIFRIFFFF
jgi:hypothetical protein